MQRYKVTCLGCGASRTVGIVSSYSGDMIDWLDNNPDPQVVNIVSGRKRLDEKFGWQCICGNDDIMTDQENEFIQNKQSPSPTDVAELMRVLVPQEEKFEMRIV